LLLDKLFAWLRIEPKGWALVRFLTIILIVNLLNAFLSIGFIYFIGIHTDGRPDIEAFMRSMPITFMCILLPIFVMSEEFFFRLSLMFFVHKQPKVIFMSAVFLSALFGYAHGGIGYILIQGFSGLMLCLVFLKCGGLQEKPGKAFRSSSAVHLIFNWIILTPLLLGLTHG
jgi:hypothetical protein